MIDSHVTEQLAPFHLGALDDPEYDLVEGHLKACPSCVEVYLSMKRRIDRSVPLDLRPSAEVRRAIRREVSSRLPAVLRPRKRLLAMGAAAAAVALLALFLTRHDHGSAPSASPSQMIDSAVPSPLL